jgi:molybdate transport system permease protein
MMPIILPPTVLGFYYLNFLGPKTAIGSFFEENLGVSFAFSFEGILFGSIIFCTPFMMSPMTNGFRNIPKNLIESTHLLKKSRINALWHVLLPNIKRSILSAVLLTFAHTIGEFGVVLMIGGKMKETNVASVAIYDEMNALNYDVAHQYAILLLLISFVLIVSLNFLTRKNGSNIA